MFKIEWQIDSKRVDIDDMCGSIKLSNGESIIHDKLVYLENWYDAFVSISKAVSLNESYIEIDLVTEPAPLIVSTSYDSFSLSYENSHIEKISLSEFEEALRISGIELLKEIEGQDLLPLSRLVKYLEK